MNGITVILACLAISGLCCAAYLLSGLDDWQPGERRRDARSLRRLPAARRAYRERTR